MYSLLQSSITGNDAFARLSKSTSQALGRMSSDIPPIQTNTHPRKIGSYATTSSPVAPKSSRSTTSAGTDSNTTSNISKSGFLKSGTARVLQGASGYLAGMPKAPSVSQMAEARSDAVGKSAAAIYKGKVNNQKTPTSSSSSSSSSHVNGVGDREKSYISREQLPEALAGTLDHIVGQVVNVSVTYYF